MSQTCNRCNKIVHRACQSDTESADCPNLRPATLIRIPQAFYDDHTIGRSLEAPPIRHKFARHYWIDRDHPAFAELVKDAEFYVHPNGPERGWYTAAARAFLAAVERGKP